MNTENEMARFDCRLSWRYRYLLEKTAEKLGVGMSECVRMAVKELARKEGVK